MERAADACIRSEPFPGLYSEIVRTAEGEYLAIKSDISLLALNSSIWGGGFSRVRHLVNRQVPKSYMCDDPEAEMESFLQSQGFDTGVTAAMMTAAWIADAGECHLSRDNLHVSVWVTAGLSNSVRAGTTEGTDRLYPGTINTIVVVDGQMAEAAMVNAVITATEAKTAALQDLGVKARNSGLLATGTSTDAVLIASTGRGDLFRYAGTATTIGYMIGKAVYDATIRSASVYLGRTGGSAANN
ncbi:adenosylcobinamide amidohydrolase [Paenibacillus mesophilus]|uniref:adenosylcobinamide amidohydrolase n=1 Tax=Paenibacillus mesophilus TaxID=2582849 RepID=UPI0013052DD3|nr:adenosylcobinamide amidohydrolase [Paenibacillus mesophilus]